MKHNSASGIRADVGSHETFVGDVWLEKMADEESVRTSVYKVTFSPGARTAWHTHPEGQILMVVVGNGLFQTRGQPARRMYPGDSVVIPAHVEHWHGAAPDSLMQHLAIQPNADTNWLELVSDTDYLQIEPLGVRS